MASTNCISLPIYYGRLTVAASAAFQTWVGAASAAAALARVYRDGLPKPSGGVYTAAALAALRPYCIISTDDADLEAPASGPDWDQRGHLMLGFEQAVTTALANDPGGLGEAFENTIGDILDDMKALANTAGYLNISTISIPGPWVRTPEDVAAQEGDAVQMFVILGYEGLS